MIERRVLYWLVAALAGLLVGLAVVSAGLAIVTAAQDEVGARILNWIVVALLMLCGIDLVLLVVALAIRELQREE